MKRLFCVLFVTTFILHLWSKPLPVEHKHNVIIDTDGAIDDLRAITLMLSVPEIEIKGIVVSEGTLMPVDGLKKIVALLKTLGKDNIPVALGKEIKGVIPAWRAMNLKIQWGDESPEIRGSSAMQLYKEVLENSEEPLTFICLGPLTSMGEFVQAFPGLKKKITRIIWYNSATEPFTGFNYEYDKVSADKMLTSGIRMEILSNLNDANALYNEELHNVCRKSDTKYASLLYQVHEQPIVNAKLKEKHFRLFDELIVVYLLHAELFGMDIKTQRPYLRFNRGMSLNAIRDVITDMLSGTYKYSHDIAFKSFPTQRELYTYDVRQIMDTAINRYGMDEWKANVITDEFHGHLGVFSIVGAKMGIRAREYFNVGPDELEVITFAGTRPPYSCLNDGIQVGTGATLGMGTIQLARDSITQPSAIFMHEGKRIMLTLKKEYLERVDLDIAEGIMKYGLKDPGYWDLVRRNALRYWVEWDRKTIFDLEVLTVK